MGFDFWFRDEFNGSIIFLIADGERRATVVGEAVCKIFGRFSGFFGASCLGYGSVSLPGPPIWLGPVSAAGFSYFFGGGLPFPLPFPFPFPLPFTSGSGSSSNSTSSTSTGGGVGGFSGMTYGTISNGLLFCNRSSSSNFLSKSCFVN
jgi:hypothetical protein